jgi:tryptophanyl-tRNA synthetase
MNSQIDQTVDLVKVEESELELESESEMTPWKVKGKVNYMAQIKQFGTKAIDGDLIKKIECVTGMPVPTLIRRGLVYSHLDLEILLDSVSKGVAMYIYTGRGPSAGQMHLGHLVPFKLARYLQRAFNCIVVIQMSDEEKYFFKDGSGPIDLDRYRKYSYDNAREIIACGFDLNKTLIFSDLECNAGDLFFNNVLIMKATPMSTIKAIYGLGEILPESVLKVLQDELRTETSKNQADLNKSKIDDLTGTIKKFTGCSASSVGQCIWPVFQSAPAFCTSFKEIFAESIRHIVQQYKKVLKELKTIGAEQSILCLVPMAIDQAPYFRMARAVASTLKCPKPAVIYSEFLPGLQQSHGKMSTTDAGSSTLFLNMSRDQVKKTIKRYALSGGKDNLVDHQKYGGDIRIDICYQYLTFFLEDDLKLNEIAEAYTSGRLSSGELKEYTAEIIANEIASHQEALSHVTDQIVMEFFNWNRVLDVSGCFDRMGTLQGQDEKDYGNYGINFDRTFGYVCRPIE